MDNLIPWEKEIYVEQLLQWIEEEKQKHDQ